MRSSLKIEAKLLDGYTKTMPMADENGILPHNALANDLPSTENLKTGPAEGNGATSGGGPWTEKIIPDSKDEIRM